MPQLRMNETIGDPLPPRNIPVDGVTVREALDSAFQTHPPLRGRLLDHEGRLLAHVVVFVDGGLVEDREGLSDPIDPDSELLVMQAS